MKIKRICAWCNRDMGWASWENFDESLPRITHSMCEACYANILEDLESSNNQPMAINQNQQKGDRHE